MTDETGRFVIELKEKATYTLRFLPIHHAALIVYDVTPGTDDVCVTLPTGGTIRGRLIRIERGKEVPIPNARVKLRQTSRTSFVHLGSGRDRKTTTDAEGRFQFDHVRTLIREGRGELRYAPRLWALRYEGTTEIVRFPPGQKRLQIDLVVRPKLADAQPLAGHPLPYFTGIGINLGRKPAQGTSVLVCFFDYQQRPSRQCLLQLAGHVSVLRAKGIEIVAVETSKMPQETLGPWIEERGISFPIATVEADVAETRFNWNVQSLPWLILADADQIVQAEGLTLRELEEELSRPGDTLQ